MANTATHWKQIIRDNMVDLINCTGIGVVVVTTLSQNQMINKDEEHFLMNENNTPTQRAHKLYSIIAPRWQNSKFPQFKRALEAGANSQALTYFQNATWIEPTAPVGDTQIDWDAFVLTNYSNLIKCTVVGNELAIHLYQLQMITDTEMHLLTDSRTPNSDRAILLYTKIAPRWVNAQFAEFKRALQVSKNARALEIFNTAV